MPHSIFRLAGATALAGTLVAGAGQASVVVSNEFAGQEASLGNTVRLDVDGNGIDDLEIDVVVPVVVDEGDIDDPGPVVPLSTEINGPVDGEKDIHFGPINGPLPEQANIRGLPRAFGPGVASETAVAAEFAPDWAIDAKTFAPGEAVNESAFESGFRGGRLYGSSELFPIEEGPNQVLALDLVAPKVFGPIPNVGDSAFFGFKITTGTPGAEYGAPLENQVDTYGWIELTHGSVIVGQVGLQSVPGAAAPVPSEVPVPAAGLLLLGGLAGLGALSRRRARA